jgi:hypothetical protein
MQLRDDDITCYSKWQGTKDTLLEQKREVEASETGIGDNGTKNVFDCSGAWFGHCSSAATTSLVTGDSLLTENGKQ